MGFAAVARHRAKDVTLYRQGGINFIVNHEPGSFAQSFARVHGPSVCAIAFRVRDAARAFERAVEAGAKAHHGSVGPMELNIPAIQGIGGSLIYFVDRYGERSIYDVDFLPIGAAANASGSGLAEIDHLTHNVQEGRMDQWAEFYEQLFGFREIRYFDIHGERTGLRSRALVSPCGKIRIPINEPADSKSQVKEYLDAYNGEGIQHIALTSDDICASVERLIANGVPMLSVPDTYYEEVAGRLPFYTEPLDRLRKSGILIDGAADDGVLLQIFTRNVIGPIFFEIIQRKGHGGFGDGNFTALFKAIERDQIARGAV
jgi:4-hydroxyphenylpyruvate dioxygenase